MSILIRPAGISSLCRTPVKQVKMDALNILCALEFIHIVKVDARIKAKRGDKDYFWSIIGYIF